MSEKRLKKRWLIVAAFFVVVLLFIFFQKDVCGEYTFVGSADARIILKKSYDFQLKENGKVFFEGKYRIVQSSIIFDEWEEFDKLEICYEGKICTPIFKYDGISTIYLGDELKFKRK
ncbi:hypothetical protein SapgrDRAFT_3207 [Saprospira grandis DSM 2844]|uniref:Uncharacterized protein n=1 Tax=Saprospira grandis DSM 2844 TaxID=694433 RepID=J0PB23_9BACT|nr:hypothetical protein [Saprospira grandis]EJF54852.1 hypothetical protein SapgrDRAFT_3207 [Saprospira grandis DSM 2844]